MTKDGGGRDVVERPKAGSACYDKFLNVAEKGEVSEEESELVA